MKLADPETPLVFFFCLRFFRRASCVMAVRTTWAKAALRRLRDFVGSSTLWFGAAKAFKFDRGINPSRSLNRVFCVCVFGSHPFQ